MRKWIFLLLSFYQTFLTAEFSAVVSLSNEKIDIPDKLEVKLDLVYPPDHTVNLETLSQNLIRHPLLLSQPFNLISTTSSPPKANLQGDITQTLTFVLDPLIPGEHTISFLNIPFLSTLNLNSSPVDIFTKLFKVNVTLPPLDQTTILMSSPLLPISQRLPINLNASNRLALMENLKFEPIRNQSLLAERAFPWFLVLLTLFSFGFALTWLEKVPLLSFFSGWEFYKKTTPEQRAIKALEGLKEQNLPAKHRFKEFYFYLSKIIRSFSEEKFFIKAQKQTTQELVQEITSMNMFGEEKSERLITFFKQADLIKFAKKIPSTNDCEKAYQIITDLISDSKVK